MNKGYKTIIAILITVVAAAVMFGSFREATVKEEKHSDEINSYNTEKKLVIGRANDSVSLDPACTTEADSFKVTVNIFETLVKCEKEGNEIIPCLAESWKSSEDGRTWHLNCARG